MGHFTYDEEHSITIPCGDAELEGLLFLPKGAQGFVIFAHGSGSSRFSVRNQYVAKMLNEASLATLLFDLLTHDEDLIDKRTRQYRFDIGFLASRLLDTTKWCLKQRSLSKLIPGYFGASTGGAAALVAAAIEPTIVRGVVSRGGRPDLAGDSLSYVQAPTLLLAGGFDETVIHMNEEAMSKLNCIKKMEIIPGATHLFVEPGTLDDVANLATTWFLDFLSVQNEPV